MEIRTRTFILILAFILLLNIASASLNVSLADHGSNIRNKSSGTLLASENLTVLIYDSLSGGNLIYNETFTSVIVNGSWNIMLGENSSNPLSLEFGKIYYKDYLINEENVNFTNLAGSNVDRQFFYSPLGDISGEDINQSTNITASWFLGFLNASNVLNAPFSWINTTNITYEAYNSTGLIRNWNASGLIRDWNTTGYLRNWGVSDWNSSALIRNWNISGDIQNWNSSGLIRSWTSADWNSSALIRDWNTTGYLRDWSFTETDPKWTANITNYFTKAQWNVTNTSYMLIGNWNATNTSYYLASNPNSYWNTTFATFNKTYADTLYFGIGNWNATNASYLTNYNTSVMKIWQWNATNISYLLIDQFNVTNTSYLMIDKFNVTNASYRTLNNITFIGNVTSTLDFCIAGGNCLSGAGGGSDNSSWNQSYANLLYATLGSGNTSLQMFQAADNGTFLKISQWNSTNTTYDAYNSTGLIKDWNASGLIRSWSASDWNSSGLIRDWNTTGYLRDWSGVGGNSSWNQSYANLLYFGIGNWNATNTSYRTLDNITFIGNVSSTLDVCISGGNCLSNVAGGGETDPKWTANITNYFTKAQWNVTNASYLMVDRWNATNTSYALNQTLADMWTNFLSTTNTSYLMVDKWNATNTSYMLTANWNATNTSYRTLTNGTFANIDLNTTGAVNASVFCTGASCYTTTALLNKTNLSYLLIDKWNATNTSYMLTANWNATNTSYALNQTLTDMWTPFLNTTNTTYDAYNSTGLIKDWNASGLIRSWSASDWNSSGLIRNWNVSGDIQNWNASGLIMNWTLIPIAETDPKWTANITNYFTKAQWNVTNASYLMVDRWNATNTSYALNQTLADMWTNFLSTTNTSYLMVDKWNATNTSYMLIGNWNATNTSYRTLTNGTFANIDLNTTGAINASVFCSGASCYTTTALLNTTNLSYLLIDKFNVTNTSYMLIGNWNATNASYLTNYNTSIMKIWQWNSTNSTYDAYNSTGLIRNWNISGDIQNWNSSGLIRDWNTTGYLQNWSLIPVTETDPKWTANITNYFTKAQWNATNTSYYLASNPNSYWNTTFATFNKTYADTLYHSTTSQLGNTTIQIFTAVDNGTFIKISQWNVTNASYALNQTLTDMWGGFLNTTNTTYNDYNSTGLIRNWNASGYIRDWSGGSEVDPMWTANITNYFTKAQWNVTNTSYALNQTLTDMWLPFLNTTNLTYNAYNSTGLIRNWNESSWIINWNASTYIRNWGIDTALLNTTNLTYLMIDKWNATNTTYRTNYNLTWVGFLNVTDDINTTRTVFTSGLFNLTKAYLWVTNGTFLQTANWNSTNTTYLRIDQWNSTNTTYDAYNSTGLIKDWNASGLIRSWSASDWNSSGLIRDWNTTGYLQNWSLIPVTETDPKWTANITNYFTKAQWNVTNASYMLIENWNSTNTSYYLTNNLFGFYNSTNPSPVTNTSYYPIWNPYAYYNVTTIGNLPNTNNYWNTTFATFNKTFADTLYFGIGNWNATNASYLTNYNTSIMKIWQWNATNTTYRTLINGTFTTLDLNTTGAVNASVFCSGASCYTTAALLNTTNLTYLMIDRFNVTNTSYRTLINGTFTQNVNMTTMNITFNGAGNITSNTTCISIWGPTSRLEIC